MENVTGVLIMILLEMLQVLVSMILSHLILLTKKNFLVLGEGPINGINDDSTGAQEKNIITFSNIQNFAKAYITMVMRVPCK